jgi:hypothetical protein
MQASGQWPTEGSLQSRAMRRREASLLSVLVGGVKARLKIGPISRRVSRSTRGVNGDRRGVAILNE